MRALVTLLAVSLALPAAAQEDVDEPAADDDAKARVLHCLESFMNWHAGRTFGGSTAFGDMAKMRAAYVDMTIKLVDDPKVQGRYISGGTLEVGTIPDGSDPAACQTLWHESNHRLIDLAGGLDCGKDEAYTWLQEDRANWMATYLVRFDDAFKQATGGAEVDCKEIKKRWKATEEAWHKGTNLGDSLSGPATWQDSKPTCGKYGAKYPISADFIRQWDAKLAIDVDVNRIHDAYQGKLEGKKCSLREESEDLTSIRGRWFIGPNYAVDGSDENGLAQTVVAISEHPHFAVGVRTMRNGRMLGEGKFEGQVRVVPTTPGDCPNLVASPDWREAEVALAEGGKQLVMTYTVRKYKPEDCQWTGEPIAGRAVFTRGTPDKEFDPDVEPLELEDDELAVEEAGAGANPPR